LGFSVYYHLSNPDHEISIVKNKKSQMEETELQEFTFKRHKIIPNQYRPEPTSLPDITPILEATIAPTESPTLVPTTEPTDQPDSDFSVSVDYIVNPLQVSASGIDIFIMATTSLPATSVTISALPDVNQHGAYNMYMGIDDWWFNANFKEKGTYLITVTAYSADGQTASDTFTYTY